MSQMDMRAEGARSLGGGSRPELHGAAATTGVTLDGSTSRERIDVIWNSTLVCPWNCGKCCVGAIHVEVQGGVLRISTNDLSSYAEVPVVGIKPKGAGPRWKFDEAARRRQEAGFELDLAGKLRVLDNLDGVIPKIDVSGGDPLVLSETLILIRAIAERFGRENLTVTATGVGLGLVDPADLAPYVSEVNITFDGTPPELDPLVPQHYGLANLRAGVRLADHGVKVRAEIPLTLQNIDTKELTRIYRELAATPISRVLVMRLFPVGRGETREEQIPSADQYRDAIGLLRELEHELDGPRVGLQCALRHLDGSGGDENPCDAVRESFGLMADGRLLGSPWAINQHGQPIADNWVLGNLATTPITDILQSERAIRFRDNINANWGHCKIFAGLYGTANDFFERITQPADPIYIRTNRRHARPAA
jgi:MoaA/NifB/PqqE/SkfB family radical SAM enzyme